MATPSGSATPISSSPPRTQRTSLAALDVLVQTDAHGSISAAARALGLSQPSASAALRRLSRDLGLELLSRTSHGSHLTVDGRAVASWAGAVLAASDRFEQAVTALRQAPVPRVRLAASMTIAEHLAPGWLAQLGGTQGAIDVELLVRNSAAVMDLVSSNDAALGFVEGPCVRRGLRSRTIMTDSLVVVVGPAHPWARRRARRASIAELVAAKVVLREEGSGTREILEAALARTGHQLPERLPHLGSSAAVRTAVQLADSVTALSRLAVASDLLHGALVEIEIPGLDLRRKLRMVWNPEVDMTAPVRAIAALVTN